MKNTEVRKAEKFMNKQQYLNVPLKSEEQMSVKEKEEYYKILQDLALEIKKNPKDLKNKYHKIFSIIAKHIRNYDLKIIGEKNILKNKKALFMANHSCSHEFFTIHEAFEKIGTNISAFATWDEINPIIKYLFKKSSAVLMGRNDKESINNAILSSASKIMNGVPVIIFGESTWNIHPYRAMQPIKPGGVKIAAIAQVPIIPTIIEYVEVPYCCKREKEIYSKCIVKFGEPQYVSLKESLIVQTNKLYDILTEMRLELWKELGISKTSIEDVNQEVYLNHTYLKKFDALGGVEYDTEKELKYILELPKIPRENEYHMNENGDFVPGITTKEKGKKYLKGL